MENIVEQTQSSAFAVTRQMAEILANWGVSDESVTVFLMIIQLVIVLTLTLLIQWGVRKLLAFVLKLIGKKQKMKIANELLMNKFPAYLALFAPMSWLLNTVPIVFEGFPSVESFILKALQLFVVFILYSMVISIIKSVVNHLQTFDKYGDKPIESYFQVVKILVAIFAIAAFFAILTNSSLKTFFGTMGAASAIMMLVFKDTILGFVASVQVTTNDMVRKGDWITMPKYNADGDVIQITLNTVKVVNFDKTIITIPTYALISDSFQNWRGMRNVDSRRIKRSIFIKQSSIRFIKRDEFPRFLAIQRLESYMLDRQNVIDKHNEEIGADTSISINGRNLTNIGLFRKYTELYLRSHPNVRQNMTLMVRQLAPTSQGLPLEIYCFANTSNWVKYENTMSDIFDHLIAATSFFDLIIFEENSSNDKRIIVLENAESKS